MENLTYIKTVLIVCAIAAAATEDEFICKKTEQKDHTGECRWNEEKLDALETELKELRKIVDLKEISRNKTGPIGESGRAVVVHAQLPQQRLRKGIVKFTTIMYNNAYAYDPHTGMFTAPSSGLYLFSAKFCMNPRSQITVEIVRGSVQLSTMVVGNPDWSQCSSDVVIVQLSQGEKIYVRAIRTQNAQLDTYYATSHFTGALVLTL